MTPRDDSPSLSESLDLLVDGELPPAQRRALLLRLESEPDGWRRCALAFLEAQEWRDALAVRAAEPPVVAPVARPSRPRSSAWLARAAAILLAFALGWAARPTLGPEPDRPEVPGPTIASAPEPPSSAPPPAAPPADPGPPPAPSYVRGRLEREGYRVEQRRVYVPTATRDGHPVVVPAREVQVRYVGNRPV